MDREKLQNLINELEGMKKETDIVANGPDDYDHCECEECEEKTKYNSTINSIIEVLKKKNEEINKEI